MKILAHYILFEKKIYKNSIVEITDNNVSISDFKEETANTEFHNGIIIVGKNDYSGSIGYFKDMLEHADAISDALVKIAEETADTKVTGNYKITKISF